MPESNEGHRQRLRDRFLEKGVDALTDSDILELLLTLGTPRRDCKKMARAALEKFGSLQGVLDAPPDELTEIHGIGPINSFAVSFVQSVSRRYLKERIKEREYLHSSGAVAEYLVHSMRGLKKEILNVIFLDAAHGIIDSEIVAEGTLTTNTIYPRELVKKAIQHHAAAIIIAHNHPSGSLSPSTDDIRLTRHLFMACSLVNINLLDHLIVGSGEKPYSFADHGLMAEIRQECRKVAEHG
ncbi:MAG: DNA repair protein RadC [Proteobacteria bacterium]|nr:DNA repair protein RadC [Pseudomonadota bacterium]MBU1739450.1 DNA repair protein RadC [Pseudomonadota bacterium]